MYVNKPYYGTALGEKKSLLAKHLPRREMSVKIAYIHVHTHTHTSEQSKSSIVCVCTGIYCVVVTSQIKQTAILLLSRRKLSTTEVLACNSLQVVLFYLISSGDTLYIYKKRT